MLFFDKSGKQDKVVLIDASKMGYEEKDGNNIRTFLAQNEIDKIVDTFNNKIPQDDFSVVVSHDDIKTKGYSLSAGQYFDVKIEYNPITAEEFNERVMSIKNSLSQMFQEAFNLENDIISQTDKTVMLK